VKGCVARVSVCERRAAAVESEEGSQQGRGTFLKTPSRLNLPVTTPMEPVIVSGCATTVGTAMAM